MRSTTQQVRNIKTGETGVALGQAKTANRNLNGIQVRLDSPKTVSMGSYGTKIVTEMVWPKNQCEVVAS